MRSCQVHLVSQIFCLNKRETHISVCFNYNFLCFSLFRRFPDCCLLALSLEITTAMTSGTGSMRIFQIFKWVKHPVKLLNKLSQVTIF